MTKAFLIAVFDVSSGAPIIQQTEIKSAPVEGLTRRLDGTVVLMDVTHDWGADYEEAIENLKSRLATGPEREKYRWALRYLREPPYKKGDVVRGRR